MSADIIPHFFKQVSAGRVYTKANVVYSPTHRTTTHFLAMHLFFKSLIIYTVHLLLYSMVIFWFKKRGGGLLNKS